MTKHEKECKDYFESKNTYFYSTWKDFKKYTSLVDWSPITPTPVTVDVFTKTFSGPKKEKWAYILAILKGIYD